MNSLQIISRENEFKLKVNGAEIDHVTGYEIKQTATNWAAHVALEFEVDGNIDIDLSADHS
mgnify:FL=1